MTSPEPVKPTNVETKTFVNNQDVKEMSDDQIYAAISVSENEIKKLSDLKAQPKRLQKRIAELQKGVDDLVAILDAKE